MRGHVSAVTSVAFSKDQRFMIRYNYTSAPYPGTIVIGPSGLELHITRMGGFLKFYLVLK